MLLQIIHWTNMAGTVLEGLLLLRVLTLRLQRMYAFVTLYWASSLIFDGAAWAFGWESAATSRLTAYTLFVSALIFPLVAWDVFEEMKPAITQLRLQQASRLVSGMFLTLLLTAIWFALSGDEAEKDPDGLLTSCGVLLWFGAACVSSMFVWSLRHLARKQQLVVPRNTSVWTTVFLLLMWAVIADALAAMTAVYAGQNAVQVITLAIDIVQSAAMAWALLRVRAIPSQTSPEPQEARL